MLAPDSAALNHPCLDPPNLSWAHDLHANFRELREGRGQISQILDRSGLPNNWGDNAAYLEGPGG